MLIPIGHEGETLRRWPVVTLAIIALCGAMFVLTTYGPQADDRLVVMTFVDAAEYYLEHPELDAHPLLEAWTADYLEEEPEHADPTPLQQERQAHLDTLTATWLRALRAGPDGRYGFIPGESSMTRIVTSLFVHADIFHLFFNMLFLYLTGPLIEDVWGRSFFAIFYVFASFIGTGLFALRDPFPVSLIGASDAIAGVMGAMLVRRPEARIRILWWWNFSFQRFTVPAWTVLLAWGSREVLAATGILQASGGTAHWTHVYGFGCGVVVACVIKVLDLERLLIRRPGGEADHAVLRRVDRALAQGRDQDAWGVLTDHLRRVPEDRDSALAYWDLAKQLGRCDLAGPFLVRTICTELDQGLVAEALAHWFDLRARAPGAILEVDLMARVAAVLAEGGADGEAEDLVREAASRVNSTTPAATIGRLTQVAKLFSGQVNAQIAARVGEHPAYRLQ